jgi:hypothetical protein
MQVQEHPSKPRLPQRVKSVSCVSYVQQKNACFV